MDKDQISTKGISLRDGWFGLSTPIGVIGAFTALSEIAMAAAVIFADGSIRWGALVLAVLIFFCTAGPFWYVLWHRNYVLYPPREYDKVDVGQYTRAMTQHRGMTVSGEDLVQSIEVSVQKAVTAAGPELVKALEESNRASNLTADEQITIKTVEEVVNQSLHMVALNAVERVRDELFIEVTFPFDQQFGGATMTDLIPVDASTTVDQFIVATIGSRYSFPLPPDIFSKEILGYGQTWVLRDETSGKHFADMGPMWALVRGQSADDRSIFEVGLRPGMSLSRVSLT